jgi:acyl-homoserine-lactone acylase
MLLENFSPLMGRNGFEPPERIEQSLRTRQGFIQAEERIAGTDGLGNPGFTIDLLRDIMFGSRNIAGEMTRDDVVAICRAVPDWTVGTCGDGSDAYSANPVEAAQGCTILADWDGLFNIDSVGAALWRNVWFRMNRTANLWVVPFDADDPVGTPNTLNVDDPAVVDAVRCALGGGVDFLVDKQIPLDRRWGEVQFRWNGDRSMQIPVHGGSSGFMWSVISSNFVDGEGYSDIPHGNSYIQTVTWDESECPVAYAVLTYSQSTDPASPHYSDWTELFSGKGWNDMPFCEADIEDAEISRVEIMGSEN